MNPNEPTIRGLRNSLNTRQRAAERELAIRPKSARADLLIVKIKHARELIELYLEGWSDENKTS